MKNIIEQPHYEPPPETVVITCLVCGATFETDEWEPGPADDDPASGSLSVVDTCPHCGANVIDGIPLESKKT